MSQLDLVVFCFQLSFARLSNLESENLELNQQVGELGRALGQEAAAYQAQVLIVLIPRCTNLAVIFNVVQTAFDPLPSF